jgi:hypothetical protein
VIEVPGSRIHDAGTLLAALVALLIAAVLMPASPPAHAAQDASERGLEIARQMKERDRGFGNSTATMRMVLVDASGGETVRELQTSPRAWKRARSTRARGRSFSSACGATS